MLKAVGILKKELGNDVAIVAGIIGPLTIAGSLVDMVTFLKATIKAPEKIVPFLNVGEQAETVKQIAKQSIAEGIQILAPGCSVAPGSPTENLKALVEVAKAH